MFLDASAIVAILKAEPESQGFVAALEAARGKVMISPIARFEAVVSLALQMARARGEAAMTPEDAAAAEALVDELLQVVGAREMHVTESIGKAARQAAMTYGAAAGHPANLDGYPVLFA